MNNHYKYETQHKLYKPKKLQSPYRAVNNYTEQTGPRASGDAAKNKDRVKVTKARRPRMKANEIMQ